jgi:hypothetical protein
MDTVFANQAQIYNSATVSQMLFPLLCLRPLWRLSVKCVCSDDLPLAALALALALALGRQDIQPGSVTRASLGRQRYRGHRVRGINTIHAVYHLSPTSQSGCLPSAASLRLTIL